MPRNFWVNSGPVRIHGLDWGGFNSGYPVVMLHGIGSTGMSFNMLAPRLVDAVGTESRVVSIDQRGSGDSDKPLGGYDPKTQAADVMAVVEAMGKESAILIGHSRGGWLAASMAHWWPERVHRLILIDPARLLYGSREELSGRYSTFKSFLGPFESWDSALGHAREQTPDAYWGDERMAAEASKYYEAFDGSIFGKMPTEVFDELLRVRAEGTDNVSLSRVVAPTLVFVSSRSNAERQAQKLEYVRRIRGARCVSLDGTHSLQHDCVEDVASEIVKHLA